MQKPEWRVLLTLTQQQLSDTHSRVSKCNRVLLPQVLTGSKGGSLGSKMEVEEEGGEAAATGISVHSLAGAACEDMAEEKHISLHYNAEVHLRAREASLYFGF